MVDNCTLSNTFLACLWLGNLPFFFFFKSPSFLFLHFFTTLMITVCFTSQGLIFKTLSAVFSTLARWVRWRWKRPSLFWCLWEQKRAWTSLSLEPVISVFGDWSSWCIVSIRGHFTSLLCRGGNGGPEREGVCPEWDRGCPSQDENQLGSWSLLLWIVVISEFIRDQL